jgi:S4 domain-containing protein
MSIYKKMRLDRILVDRGLAVTRSRAADLIRIGAVSVDGERALKPGAMIEPGARLIVDAQGSPFVSRGGLKLAARSTPSACRTPGRPPSGGAGRDGCAAPGCRVDRETGRRRRGRCQFHQPDQGLACGPQPRGARRLARCLGEAVGRLGAARITVDFMVSCNPGTCARDLRILFDGGYHITRVVPVDQFLFSPHIELVAVLER